jgi:starch phosphorylase
MVADYVEKLYVPAAVAGRAVDGPAAKQLATFKARVRAHWSGVRVDHVESAGVSDSPQVGDTVEVRAFVSLGELEPEEVDVQVVYGRVTPEDTITDGLTAPLVHAESFEAGRHRYDGSVRLRRTGPFGYTVRVLPRGDRLANPAELGLVTNA